MLRHLLDNLNDDNHTVRKEAIRQAHNLTPEQLLELFELETELSRRNRVAEARTVGLAPTVLMLGAGFLLLRSVESLATFCVLLPCACVCFTLPSLLRYRPTVAHKSLTALLSTVEDTRFLGPILTILGEPYLGDEEIEFSWKPNLEAALKRILPRVRPEQASLLTERQKSMLLVLLSMPYIDVELTLCTLSALSQIGDARALSTVQRLADANAITPKTRKVRDAARACLEHIRLRVELARQSQTLLRASCLDPDPPEQLLRPMITYPTTPPEQLLRPPTL